MHATCANKHHGLIDLVSSSNHVGRRMNGNRLPKETNAQKAVGV
jgi:hypothetical protein